MASGKTTVKLRHSARYNHISKRAPVPYGGMKNALLAAARASSRHAGGAREKASNNKSEKPSRAGIEALTKASAGAG